MLVSSWLLLLYATVLRLERTSSACGVAQYEALPKVCVSHRTVAVTDPRDAHLVGRTIQEMGSLSVCYATLSPFWALASDIQKTDTRHYSRGRFHQSLLAVQVAKQREAFNERESLPTSSSQDRQSLFQTADRRTHPPRTSPLPRASIVS